MRRFSLLIAFIVISWIVVFADNSLAAVTGRCDTCHTMHNSQNGAPMADAGRTAVQAGECLHCHAALRPNLLRMDCIGCHVSTNVANVDPVTLAPQVLHGAPDLAAGNFNHLAESFGDDALGHNLHGFSDAGINDIDIRFTGPSGTDPVTPPGYLAAYDPSSVKYADSGRGLMCAGANGCHGNRDEVSVGAAMKGTHHANDSMLKFGTINEATQGTNAGTSYRMLRGVKGGEAADWQNRNATNHNEYKGKAFAPRTGQTYADVSTISDFCSSCHGIFHMSGTGGIGTGGSPWLRHPVDVQMPTTGEYAVYNVYDPNTPVARNTIPTNAPSNAVGPDAVVMCLSCHKAHASEYGSILRWEYNDTTSGTGCITCHTNK